jgi:hypothetical protein
MIEYIDMNKNSQTVHLLQMTRRNAMISASNNARKSEVFLGFQ